MRHIFKDKRFILLLAAIAVVILLLLAAGLRSLQFGEGRPLGILQSIPTQNNAADLMNQFEDVPAWKQGAFWALLLILLVLLASLLSP